MPVNRMDQGKEGSGKILMRFLDFYRQDVQLVCWRTNMNGLVKKT